MVCHSYVVVCCSDPHKFFIAVSGYLICFVSGLKVLNMLAEIGLCMTYQVRNWHVQFLMVAAILSRTLYV